MGNRLRASEIVQRILSQLKQVLQVGSRPVEVLLSQLGKVRLAFLVQLEDKLFLPRNVEARSLDNPCQQSKIRVHGISMPHPARRSLPSAGIDRLDGVNPGAQSAYDLLGTSTSVK